MAGSSPAVTDQDSVLALETADVLLGVKLKPDAPDQIELGFEEIDVMFLVFHHVVVIACRIWDSLGTQNPLRSNVSLHSAAVAPRFRLPLSESLLGLLRDIRGECLGIAKAPARG